MTDLNKAKEGLFSGEYTCVIRKGEDVRVSKRRGVKPLVEWIDNGENFNGYSAADKVIGKATAFLYVLLGVKSTYAGVVSKSALETLQEYGIETEYGALVDNIINRSGDGICPFETAVLDVKTPQAAYEIIKNKIREMNL